MAPKLLRQTIILTKKCFKLQARNRVSTCTQLFIGIVFLLLLQVMDFALKSTNNSNSYYTQDLDPPVHSATEKLEKCSAYSTIDEKANPVCYTFVYAPLTKHEDNGAIDRIVQSVLNSADLDTALDAPYGAKRFASVQETETWIRKYPNITKAAVYFGETSNWATNSSGSFQYELQLNYTRSCKEINSLGCDNPLLSVGIPLQAAIDSAFIKEYSSFTQPTIKVSFSDFPHPTMPALLDVVARFGSSFLYIAVTFNFVIQMTLLVQEKEDHLVDSMRQMGMMGTAYWLSWFLTNTFINTLMVMLLITFGYIINFEFFTETAFGLVFTLLWLTVMCFTAMAFLLSTLTRKTSTARLFGIGIFVVTFIASPILVSVYFSSGSEDDDSIRTILARLPFMAFYHVLGKLIEGSSGPTNKGLNWEDRLDNLLPVDPDNKEPSVWTLEDSLLSIIEGFLIFTVLTWYLDRVLPNEYGKRDPPWFFLNPILPKSWRNHNMSNHSARVLPANSPENVDDEVKKEAEAVEANEFGTRNPAVVIDRLYKIYGNFHAVDNVSYAVDTDSCFVMLGHNGAGKSTTLGMLTGLSSISHGDATVFGYSVKEEMGDIRKIMGVCPQHDVLWDKLNGREHLELFAVLKGIPDDKIKAEVEARLADVMLTSSADVPSGSYSGGMQRRLSIAIALLGDPKIVYLDEPTTGMDPENRRYVWDMIARAKKGRVIVLTTHSMEEADILGDRIGVMSHGKLQALGTSLRLKSQYGSGYRMTMFVDSHEHKDKVVEFVNKHGPSGTKLASDVEKVLLFQLPRQRSPLDLVPFFRLFESSAKELGVSDFSIGLTTLEEVFLNLSEQDKFIENVPEANNQNALKETAEFTGKRTTIGVQIAALGIKAIVYQKKQRLSCCFIVMYPVVIMLALMALETAVFQSFRLSILCGTATKEECPTKGLDLECTRKGYELTFSAKPALQVGVIKTSGRTGGVNPNCNDDSCFHDLERGKFSSIPYFVDADTDDIGTLDYSQESTQTRLADFDANLYFMLRASKCDADYAAYFEPSDNPICISESINELKCRDRVKQFEAAETLIKEEKSAESPSSGSNDTEVCSIASATIATVTVDEATKQLVRDWQSTRDSCNKENMQQVFELFNSETLKTDLSALKTKGEAGSGVLGSFSTSMVWDTALVNLITPLVMSTPQGSGGASSLDFTSFDPTDYISLVCSSNTDRAVVALIIGDTTPNQLIVSNFCEYMSKYDQVRAVAFQKFETNEDFRVKGIYDKWGGEEVQTQFMKENAASELSKADQYLSRQYLAEFGAFHFRKVSLTDSQFDYVAYYNNSGTGDTKSGNWQSLTWLMNNAIVSSQVDGKGIKMKLRGFPRKFTCNRDEWLADPSVQLQCDILPGFLVISILDFVSITLFPYLLMIHMFIVASLIVYEKENKLRMIMKMMGLNNSVYWIVNYVFYFIQYLVMVVMMYIMGRMANLQMFVLHEPFVVWAFLLTWGNLMVAFSFLLSIFFSSSRTSTAAIFLMMLIFNTTGANLIENLMFDQNLSESSMTPLMFFPPLVMIRILYIIGTSGAFKEPITSQNWGAYMNGTLPYSIGIMWLEWAVCLLLVWYLDKVWVVGFGVRQPPLFFLDKDFWSKTFSNGKLKVKQALSQLEVSTNLSKDFKLEPDAQAEHDRVVDSNAKDKVQVRVARLHKKYDNGFIAVKSVSLGINKNECFGLLGHNGAGKTTTLSMLCGLFEPTSGDARVGDLDYSILSDLPMIHAGMGVCPQHDVLWASLSAEEHLYFYGRLKGLRGSKLKEAVVEALKSVNLYQFRSRNSGAFSGGMKRRLSVAISLIGNPVVCIMDEPSTGLDPSSRRQLWDVISKAKGNKSIILTTHSMEEAEVLCDRLGVMADGELQCIGLSSSLKQRYGAGFSCTVTSSDRSEEGYAKIKSLITKLFPSAKLLNEPMGGTSNFEIQKQDVVLSTVFEQMESCKAEYCITDWGITETSLEEVFLALAQLAHEKKV